MSSGFKFYMHIAAGEMSSHLEEYISLHPSCVAGEYLEEEGGESAVGKGGAREIRHRGALNLFALATKI